MNHDCCNKKDKQHATKTMIDPFIASVIGITVIVFGIVVFLGLRMNTTAKISTDNQVRMEIAENTYDWGTIDIDGGIVSTSFTIENKGSTPLKLYDVKTSCMCTTAQLKNTEQRSKKFGMHEKSSSVFEVKPRETAQLVVEFDPAFHGPSGIGPISRTVTMNTNSVDNPSLTFQLAGNVVKN